jgi:hypothetical protein
MLRDGVRFQAALPIIDGNNIAQEDIEQKSVVSFRIANPSNDGGSAHSVTKSNTLTGVNKIDPRLMRRSVACFG